MRKTQDAVRKRVTRLVRSFSPNPNPDRSVRLQLKRRAWQEDRSVQMQLNTPATLLANEGRVRSRLRFQRNRSELFKAQCSRRAMQIRTSVRGFCMARARARDAARKRVTRSVTRLRLQRNRSELCKTQCSRRAMQIRTSVRAFCKAGSMNNFACPLLTSDAFGYGSGCGSTKANCARRSVTARMSRMQG